MDNDNESRIKTLLKKYNEKKPNFLLTDAFDKIARGHDVDLKQQIIEKISTSDSWYESWSQAVKKIMFQSECIAINRASGAGNLEQGLVNIIHGDQGRKYELFLSDTLSDETVKIKLKVVDPVFEADGQEFRVIENTNRVLLKGFFNSMEAAGVIKNFKSRNFDLGFVSVMVGL